MRNGTLSQSRIRGKGRSGTISGLFLAALWISLAAPCLAQETPAAAPIPDAAASPPAGQEPAPTKPPSVLNAVKRAKAMLQNEIAKRRAAKKAPRAASHPPPFTDVTLAIWDRATDAIALVQAKKNGSSVTALTAGDWPFHVDYDAKSASRYSLPPERNQVVVGVRYPVTTARRISRKKKVYDTEDIVSVPYNGAFFVPEVLSAGSDYLSYLIQGAFDELRRRGVKSRAFPDRLVADVIDPYLIKSIVVIEHADHHALLRQDDPEHTLGVFLARLALNGDDAFDGSTSTAGALGLAQFIPSTYRLFVRNRTDLALIPDFAAGMNDHKNAVKAEVAYLDESLAEMPDAIRAVYASDRMKAAEFLAAAYNGGSTRVLRAYASYGESWAADRSGELAALQSKAARLKSDIAYRKKLINKSKDVAGNKKVVAKEQRNREVAVMQIASLKKASLKLETVLYVAKLKKTYGMFATGVFATPAAPSGALPQPGLAGLQPPSPLAQAAPQAGAICFGDGSCAAQ